MKPIVYDLQIVDEADNKFSYRVYCKNRRIGKMKAKIQAKFPKAKEASFKKIGSLSLKKIFHNPHLNINKL